MGEAVWNDYALRVEMPHMAPGEKLSEVEFLKMLAAYQWESIARALSRRPPAIVSEDGARLYGSIIDIELHVGPRHSMEVFGEDARIQIENRVHFYSKKFVEGLFVIDDVDVPAEVLSSIKSRADLQELDSSWACMTNAFIARTGGNARLRVFRPAGADEADVPVMKQAPEGVLEQARVQKSGVLPWPEGETGFEVAPREARAIVYRIVPESDLNGAGLVYFARYAAMMNYGERIFLTQRLERPVSSDFVASLSMEHRRAVFFANAAPTDDVEIFIEARLLPSAGDGAGRDGPYRTPFHLVFRIDLYRASDGVLMATSTVRKGLNVPASLRPVLAEAERFAQRYAREDA